jgi:hypothetical protein
MKIGTYLPPLQALTCFRSWELVFTPKIEGELIHNWRNNFLRKVVDIFTSGVC